MAELKDIAIAALESEGYTLRKSPDHHGLAMCYIATKDGDTKLIAIRTTKNSDNGISFVPHDDGRRWKTLLDNDQRASPDKIVIVSANDPTSVHVFKGIDVQRLYIAEYNKRVSDGKHPQDGRGFWISLRDFPVDGLIISVEENDAPIAGIADLSEVVKKARKMVAAAVGLEIGRIRVSIDWV
jgi:hypothetical protein